MKLALNLAYNVRRIQKDRDLSQEDLAELCDISTQEVSKIENTRANTGLKVLQKLCDNLEISSDDLFREIPEADKAKYEEKFKL